MVMSSCGE
uniref:Uncharacterized protein n=1 Tax=Rhizophora mucronata TaxID=61149 RepID=A0A2P2NNM0_RHIMU